MPIFAMSVFFVLLLLTGTSEAQRCLHGADESGAERARRRAAIEFVGQLNDAERRLERERGTYVALVDAVSLASVPFGFVPRLVFDRWSYMVSLKDTLDPCRFSLFSDQDGVIYEAHPSAAFDDKPRQEPRDVMPEPLD